MFLLSESTRPPVIGFGFTHQSPPDAHVGRRVGRAQLARQQDFLFKCQLSSLNATEAGTRCDGAGFAHYSCFRCIKTVLPLKPFKGWCSVLVLAVGAASLGGISSHSSPPPRDGSIARCPCVGSAGLIGCDDSYALNCVSYSSSVALLNVAKHLM